MDRAALIDEITRMISNYLKDQGWDLVDLVYRYEGRDLFLRILADKPEGGISLGDCAYLNHEISRLLDEQEIIPERYILEVSSPGIDRPIKTRSDFLRCIDRRARFFLREPINGKIEMEGAILKVEDEAVYIDREGSVIKLPLAKINQAKQIIDHV